MKYAFFSFIQEKLNKEYSVYIDENNKQVVVTEISDYNIILKHKNYFSDSMYVGKVKHLVKTVKLNIQ